MKKYFISTGLILLALALAFALLTKDHDWGDDWAAYVMQSAAITRGETQEFIARNTFTMRESTRFFGPDAYPWGFPALLAPFVLACGPLNVFCLKFINLIFFALFLWGFHIFLARRLPLLEAGLLLGVFAVSPVLLQFNDLIQSDIPFLFFSTLALLLIEEIVVRDETILGSPRKNIWLGVILFFAFFVRTNGILLLATLFLTQIYLHWRTRPRPALDRKRILTVGLIPYLAFGLLTVINLVLFPAGEGSHLEHLGALNLLGLLNNLSSYIAMPSLFFAALPQPAILYGVMLPFFLGGMVLNHRRDIHIIIYFGLSYALFIIWPEQQGIRFLFPLLPFFVYFTYRGMIAISLALTKKIQRLGQSLARGFWIAVILIFAWTSFGLTLDNLEQGRGPYGNVYDPQSIEMFVFIQSETPADAVIAFYKPRVLRLFTDRDTLMIETCDALSKADYVVLRKSRGAVDQVAPGDVDTCNPSLTLTKVFDNEKFVVYEIALK
ncbi:MAG: hypothetical protein HFACDABA_02427 [Anaerolineales bacterium]|nr:hypothetical protein [Anaerolineales bacterium]